MGRPRVVEAYDRNRLLQREQPLYVTVAPRFVFLQLYKSTSCSSLFLVRRGTQMIDRVLVPV